jgi:hypothetical protein
MEIVQQVANIHEVLVQKFKEIGISYELPDFSNDEIICVGIYSNNLNSEYAAGMLRDSQIEPVIQRIKYNLEWLLEVHYIGVKRVDFQRAISCIQAQAIAFTDLKVEQVSENADFRKRSERFWTSLGVFFISLFGLFSVYLAYKSLQQGKLESILIFGCLLIFNIFLCLLLIWRKRKGKSKKGTNLHHSQSGEYNHKLSFI